MNLLTLAQGTQRPFQTDDPSLLPIAAKVRAGERLSFEDGVALYRSGDILAVGWMANLVRDVSILMQARQAAFDLLSADPRLEKPENRMLREELLRAHGPTALASIA